MKSITIPLDGTINNNDLPALVDAPDNLDVLNLRAPRRLGIPSKQPKIEPTPVLSCSYAPNVVMANNSGQSLYVNQPHPSLPAQIVDSTRVGSTATGIYPGALLQNSWIPLEVTNELDGVMGQVAPDTFSCCMTTDGYIAVAAVVDTKPYFLFTVMDQTGRVIVPRTLVSMGTAYRGLIGVGDKMLPIRLLAHDNGIVSVWYTGWDGTFQSILLRSIDTRAATPVLSAPTQVKVYTPVSTFSMFSVSTCPGAGNKAWLFSLYPTYTQLVLSSMDVVTGLAAGPSYTFGSTIDDVGVVLDVQAYRTTAGRTWVSAAWITLTSKTRMLTLDGSTMVPIIASQEINAITNYNNGVVVTHASSGSVDPVVLVYSADSDGSTNTAASIELPGTLVTRITSGSAAYATTVLPCLNPYGVSRLYRDGDWTIPIVPFVRVYQQLAFQFPELTETVVEDPSLNFLAARCFDSGSSLWTHSSVMRVGVDELYTLNGYPMNMFDVSGSTGTLTYAISNFSDPNYFADGLKLLSFDVNPTDYLRTLPLKNSAIVAAAQPMHWDGSELVEVGFLHSPQISVSQSNGTGPLIPAGTYFWQAIYTWRDAHGDLHRSAPSNVTSLTLTGSGDRPILYVADADTVRSGLLQTKYNIEIYGTSPAAGGSFYQINQTYMSSSLSGRRHVFTNVTTGSNQYTPIYSTGGELEANAPPALWDVVEVGNRLFGIDATNRTRIVFTKPKQAGLAYEWSTFTNNVVVDDTAGKAVAVREMQGYLIIFCERGIYLLQGDGPNFAGVGEFVPPVKISDSQIDPRSRSLACSTPAGIFFKRRDRFAVLQSLQGQVSPLYNYNPAPSALPLSARWNATTEELLVFTTGETLTFDVPTLRVSRLEWAEVPRPRDWVQTQFSGENNSGAFVVGDTGIFKVLECTSQDISNGWSIDTGWIAPLDSSGEVAFSEVVVELSYQGPGSTFVLEQFFNYSDDAAGVTVVPNSYITSSNVWTVPRPRMRFRSKVSNAVSSRYRLSNVIDAGTTNDTILPISLTVMYEDVEEGSRLYAAEVLE